MSIRLMSKAWDLDIPASPKLVFLALCDSADDTTKQCFPSLHTITKKAGVSKANLSYILRAFENLGALTREGRSRRNGADTSTLYTVNHFNIDAERFKEEYQKAKGYRPRQDQSEEIKNDKTPQSEHGGCSHSEHPKYPKVNTTKTPQSEHAPCSLSEHATYTEPKDISFNHQSKEVVLVDDFDTFWSAYPNKVGKANAKKSWDKKKPDLATVLNALGKQKLTKQWSKNNGQFIPHPATWINGERWNDEVTLSDADMSAAIMNVGGMSATEQLKQMGIG